MTLKAPSFAWDDPSEVQYWTAVKEAFEAVNPHITVDAAVAENYFDTVLTDMLAGNAGDVVWGFDNQMDSWIEQDVLEPLNPWIDQRGVDVSQFAKAQQVVIRNGQVYGILVALNPRVLVYNQALLDDAGVDVPTNLDEFVGAVEAVRAKGDESTFGFATITAATNSATLYKEVAPIIAGFGGNFFVDGRPTANSPETVAALELIEDLYNRKLIPAGMDNTTYWDAFVHGKIAMLSSGTFVLNTARDQAPDNFATMGASPLPFSSGKAGASSNEYLAIPRAARHKDEAFAFIAQTLDRALEAQVVEKLGAIPATGTVSDEQLAQAPYFEAAAEVALNATPLTPGLADNSAKARDIITNWYQEMLFTDLAASEAAEKMQSELEALVSP